MEPSEQMRNIEKLVFNDMIGCKWKMEFFYGRKTKRELQNRYRMGAENAHEELQQLEG